MKNISPKYLFYFILLVAIVARIWDLFNIPFTYDELSTLYRIDGGWEEIKLKIAADNHPPGHHLIALLLKNIFGLHTWVLKFPYIAAGIGSLILVYRIGKDWISETAGILSMALLTISQMHIMHSQISRPYALGQFFILLFVFILGRMLIKKLAFRWQDYALLLLCIIGSAYLHYIALLVVSILWVLSLFCFKETRSQKIYVVLPLASVILCLPMWSFFIEQWSHKGLSSIMDTPDISDIINHFFRVANFSWVFSVVLIITILYGWFTGRSSQNREKLFFLLAFLIPLLILWSYSVFRAPLLSDRSLFFSLPFILLLIFSFDLKKLLFPTTVLIVVVGAYSLVFERQHYTIFYHQGFEEVAENLTEDVSESGSKDRTVYLVNYNPDTYKPIKNNYPVFENLEYLNPDSTLTFNDYAAYINQPGVDRLIYANTAEFYAAPLEIIPLIEESFYFRDIQKNYFLSHYYVFNKDKETQKNYRLQLQKEGTESLIVNKEDGFELGFTFNDQEYGFELKSPLGDMITSPSDYLFYKIMYRSELPLEARMILEIKDGEDLVYWKSNPLAEYQISNNENTFTSFLAVDLSDVDLDIDNLSLKAYVWNMKREDFHVLTAEVWSEKGNPYKYALIQDF